ncbi:nucleotide exchange factor GrpE [Sphingobacterium sp. lm-10]|uniref:nucleotide exchange factor GrpE n=1 Tax=Sphingobacterium sp. lm-10 TaxID=2944904 RepID=UPI002021DC9C|nr:nucleotide exchange factor GrpE [Sphingobacterium sp. lm-10]MCL7986591.1 nucleotide exchange factor GrpE [Sphingobacterium sp. lm-10]
MVNEHEHNQEEESLEQDNLVSNEENSEQEATEAVEDSDVAVKLEEAQDKYARLLAEFENYKKRTSREKIEIIQSAGKEVIGKLLPVLDDMDRAIISMAAAQDVATVKEGVELVNTKFRKLMEQQGLKEMDVVGQAFDSEFQEAITAIPAPTDDMKNKVIDVVEKGYILNDKVIRFAKVVIGQ